MNFKSIKSKMKLLSCFLLFLSLEMYHTTRISSPENIIRIPLKRVYPTSNKLNATLKGPVIIGLNVTKSMTYGDISIGTKPQKFSVLFDTGSYSLWVYSSCYQSIAHISDRHKYNHCASSTYHLSNTNKSLEIKFETGKVQGFWSADTVAMNKITTDKQFLEVIRADDVVLRKPIDGVMGLRYNPDRGNIVTKICKKVPGGKNEFSYYLSSHNSNSHEGELILCGRDKSKYKTRTLQFANETHPFGEWFISIDRIEMRSKKEIFEKTTNVSALVDTGTNRILVPEEIFEKWFKRIDYDTIDNHETEKKVNCTTVHLLPKLVFKINGNDYVLKGMDYTRKVRDEKNEWICQLLIIPTARYDFWFLGDVFIQKFYTVFDIENHRIGFAKMRK